MSGDQQPDSIPFYVEPDPEPGVTAGHVILVDTVGAWSIPAAMLVDDDGLRYVVQTGDATPSCPECTSGKHPNCDGTTWDDAADAPTTCPCAEGGHQ